MGINSWTWKQSSEELFFINKRTINLSVKWAKWCNLAAPVTTDMPHQAKVYTCSFKRRGKKGEQKMRPKPYMLISSQNVTGYFEDKNKIAKFCQSYVGVSLMLLISIHKFFTQRSQTLPLYTMISNHLLVHQYSDVKQK